MAGSSTDLLVNIVILFIAFNCIAFDCCVDAKLQNSVQLLTKAPGWLKPCRRKDPNLNECVRNLMAHMFPQLAVGIPELGVEKFEPLFIKKITLTKGQGPVTVTGSFNDILVHGPSNASCTSARLDIAKKLFELDIDLPTLRVEAVYNLRGNILLLPLVGHGKAALAIRNATAAITNRIEFPVIAGKEVMHITAMKVNFIVRDIQMHFTNLFNGNKVLGMTVNNFVNQNHQEILRELNEPLGESLSVVFKKIFGNIFDRLPTDMWLIDDAPEKKEKKKESVKTQ